MCVCLGTQCGSHAPRVLQCRPPHSSPPAPDTHTHTPARTLHTHARDARRTFAVLPYTRYTLSHTSANTHTTSRKVQNARALAVNPMSQYVMLPYSSTSTASTGALSAMEGSHSTWGAREVVCVCVCVRGGGVWWCGEGCVACLHTGTSTPPPLTHNAQHPPPLSMSRGLTHAGYTRASRCRNRMGRFENVTSMVGRLRIWAGGRVGGRVCVCGGGARVARGAVVGAPRQGSCRRAVPAGRMHPAQPPQHPPPPHTHTHTHTHTRIRTHNHTHTHTRARARTCTKNSPWKSMPSRLVPPSKLSGSCRNSRPVTSAMNAASAQRSAHAAQLRAKSTRNRRLARQRRVVWCGVVWRSVGAELVCAGQRRALGHLGVGCGGRLGARSAAAQPRLTCSTRPAARARAATCGAGTASAARRARAAPTGMLLQRPPPARGDTGAHTRTHTHAPMASQQGSVSASALWARSTPA
jgi:hypothetical protein